MASGQFETLANKDSSDDKNTKNSGRVIHLHKDWDKIKTAVVIPHVVSHRLDVHTGIPFMPHMAAYLVSSLIENGIDVQVIDCFGENFDYVESIKKEFYFFGLNYRDVPLKIDQLVKVVFVYCRTIEDLISTEILCLEIRKRFTNVKIVLFENIQTVNSFSLYDLVDDLIPRIADVAVMGEPEKRALKIFEACERNDYEYLHTIEGVAFYNWETKQLVRNPKEKLNNELDLLAFPAWHLFNLSGYWNSGFAHAPVKKGKRFLPLLTSRGCPYRCNFCVSPAVNPTWRSRSPENVVAEIEFFYRNLQISDFHISDLDPTISDKRIREICSLLIEKKLPISWKIAQGTKIETIKSSSTLDFMKRAGCEFFSFSPETGSDKLLKIMNKKFDKHHANYLIKHLNKIGIRTQACFIAGVPGENWIDRLLTLTYIIKIVFLGVDEIAMTIFTPIPGAKFSDSLKGYSHYSELSHSPKWRKDYYSVSLFRYFAYLTFFVFKLTKPKKILRELKSILSKNFETKMEMSIYKYFKIRFLAKKIPLFSRKKKDF